MYLVVGLGNPGSEYESTRHNVGFDVVDYMAKEIGVSVSKAKFKGLAGSEMISGEKVIFLKPSTYMNLSGESVKEAADFYKIKPENIIIVYDDVAIDPGKLRIRKSGSAGGHNGMKDIIAKLGTNEFPRVRVGVGAARGNMVDHVLGRFSKEDRELVDDAIKRAKDAVEEIIKHDVDSAMNKYNSNK